MRILIDQGYILPIKDATWDKNALGLFDIYYRLTDFRYHTTFVQWLTELAVPVGLENDEYTEEEVKRYLDDLFQDNEKIQRLSFKVFPYQFEFNRENWEEMQRTLRAVIVDKRSDVHTITINSYEDNKKVFTDNIEKVLKI